MASTKALERWSSMPRTTPSKCSLSVVARRLKGSSRLRRAHEDEREPANPAPRQPERQAALRQAWADWNALMPPIPEDAAVSLGYSAKDLPQR